MTDQPMRAEGGDNERLPWIEPYREGPSAPKAAPRKAPANSPKPASKAPWIAVGSIAALTAAVGGGYWLGQREAVVDQPEPAAEIRVAERIPAPTPAIEPAPQPVVAEPPAIELDIKPAQPVVTKAEAPRPAPKAKAKRPVRKAKIRSASVKRTQYDRVVAKQRAAARTWPKMPSPGPAGQVIQLGAFTTRARAQNAYRERLSRYPVLSGMPQVVVPVITHPRGEVLYVLRLGTQSREQSNVVCRNLRSSGNHCLVIG